MTRAIHATLLLLLVAFCSSEGGTSDLSVSGRVTDINGRSLPGVRVTARHVEQRMSKNRVYR